MSNELNLEIDKLNMKNNQLQQIIDSLDVNIYWKDIEGRVLGMNKANMQAMCIDNIKNALNKTELELRDDKKSAQRIMENDAKVIQTKSSHTFSETSLNGKPGEYKMVISKKSCFRDEYDNIVGVVGVSVAI